MKASIVLITLNFLFQTALASPDMQKSPEHSKHGDHDDKYDDTHNHKISEAPTETTYSSTGAATSTYIPETETQGTYPPSTASNAVEPTDSNPINGSSSHHETALLALIASLFLF